MSNFIWRPLGLRDFKLSGRPKMEYLLGGGLILLIGLCVVVSVGQLVGGRGSGPQNIHWECQKCGHTFEKAFQDLRPEERHIVNPMSDTFYINCPSCGAEASCIQMTRCPSCGEWFVPEMRKHPIDYTDPAAIRQYKLICPHCNTDLAEYYKEHGRE